MRVRNNVRVHFDWRQRIVGNARPGSGPAVTLAGDFLSGIRQVILLQENVARLERDVQALAQDVRRIRDYSGEIDKRVARIEGVMEGVARASTPTKPVRRLTKR